MPGNSETSEDMNSLKMDKVFLRGIKTLRIFLYCFSFHLLET